MGQGQTPLLRRGRMKRWLRHDPETVRKQERISQVLPGDDCDFPQGVVREEGQDVLPEDSTPWAKELPSPTSHSNRSLRTEVSVAGKRNFQRGDKEAETTLEIQRRRCRDKITLGNSANSGLIARFREISVRTRVRGGSRRTRTSNQAVISAVTGPESSVAAPARIGFSFSCVCSRTATSLRLYDC